MSAIENINARHASHGPLALLRRYATPVRWTAIALILLGLVLLLRTLPLTEGLDRLDSWLSSLGPAGMVVFGLIYVAATVLLMPGWVLTVAAGAVFGLGWGLLVVSLASTTGAAAAFLIARYLARDRVERFAQRSPRFDAVDRAVRDGGWKIVALLRLSPAVPFNLQNYLHGLTAIGFWPYVLTSWLAMLPGTFMYVYIGYLGFESLEAAADEDPTARWGQWALLGLGLVATIAVTVYLTHLARRALRERTEIEETPMQPTRERVTARPRTAQGLRLALLTLLALALFGTGVYAQVNPGAIRDPLTGLFGPPQVTLAEAYEPKSGGPSVDHSTFDRLLRRIVTDDLMVDYELLRRDTSDLDAYIEQLAHVPFNQLDRDEKLATLINAYNAFTLQLILDHWPLQSIRDIDQPWKGPKWNLGGRMLTLDQIEHEEIRGKFKEPRTHFAVNCASIGCPPLRAEAYVPERLDAQLQDQAELVHRNGSRWFRFDRDAGVVHLTELYNWYRGDFEQVAGSVLAYAARFDDDLAAALEAGERPRIEWLKYDWALNRKGALERQ